MKKKRLFTAITSAVSIKSTFFIQSFPDICVIFLCKFIAQILFSYPEHQKKLCNRPESHFFCSGAEAMT